MPKIRYEHAFTLREDEALSRLQQLLQHFSEKYHLHAQWVEKDRAKVSGHGVQGTMKVQRGMVHFDLDLSFLLSPLKNTIESAIAQEMSRALS